MKPIQGDWVINNSCSCTSCDSKSESDRQTLKRLLVQGSRINKLLTGKYYIHLRDSNLLDKLIKTRALYDALRSQLLSSTESSTADLKPRQSSREIRKAFVEAKKSSDIFTLVDLVDKGAVIGLKKLSECCSCCTCSSKFRLHENVQKGRRNRQAHAGGNITSRSSLVSKQETGEAKNIKSDPCTCACYKHENIKKSREITEKIRSGPQIIERDSLSTYKHKLMSLNNGKMRKSYYKLKRAKAYPSPYMENIGEGGNKTIRKSKLVQEKTKSIELLKLAQKTIIDSFESDRQTLKKKEPVGYSMVGNTAEESMIHVEKTATKSKDQVGKHQVQSPELKKHLAHKSRKKYQARKANTNECMCNISDTSSTSNTNTRIPKETPFIIGNERKKNHSRAKKRNKKQQAAILAESSTEISKKRKESYVLGGSNQVQKSNESKIPPQKDPAEVVNKINKKLPFSSTPGKEPIKSNSGAIPGIQKSISINSIKKSYPTSYNKKSSNSLNKVNKSKSKSRSSVLIRKRLRLLSAPLWLRPHAQIIEEPRVRKEPARHKKLLQLQEASRISEEPRRHKKPSSLKKKKSHVLKRCLCTLKLQINETKSRISKNISNENLNVKDKQGINSKNLLSPVKTLIKASYLNFLVPKHMSGHATKCECSDYVNQSQAMRKNKRPTQNETNAHLEMKYNVTNDKQSIKYDRAQGIPNKKKLSISDCICNELDEFIYRHGQPNIEYGVKSTSNHHVSNNPKKKSKTQGEHADMNNLYNINTSIHASKCDCFDANISSEKKGRYKDQRGKSNTRLRAKSALKDASITTEKPRKLQNQSVQTAININSKQKQEIEISLKQLENKKPNTCNPKFSIELFNKNYSNNGLKITQSKVKFVYKCGDGTKQLPNKQSQTNSSTQRSKFTNTKHGLRRCFCTLQLGKQEKKKYNQRKVSKVTTIQPNSKVEGSQSQAKLKLVRHDKLPYKQFKVALIKREERNSKKRIKTKLRSNFSLTSRSMQLPRTKKIVISLNSEIIIPILKKNKTKSSDISAYRVRPIFSRKFFKSKRSSCLCSPIDKDYKMNKDIKIRSSKDSHKSVLLRNKKQEQSSLVGLTNKQCLCTLKLRKKGKHYQKSSVVITNTKSNIIADKINPKFQKGTKLIKLKWSNQLRPYESKYLEPFILEKNKINTFKHFGLVTEKTKMKSKSSDTRTLRSLSKLLFVQSDLQQRNTSLQKFKKMRKYSELSHLPQHAREMYLDNFLKQSVKMGSNFSFNIEFYKGITPLNNFKQKRSKNMSVHFLNNKQEGNLLTLKISKMDEQRRNSKLLLPFGTKKLTQVYALRTVANAKNKIKTSEILEVDHDFHCIDSYYSTYSKNASSHTKQWQYFKKNPTSGLSLSVIAFQTKNVQSYIRESKYKLLQISSRDQSLLDFASNKSLRFETAFSCKIDYLKKICSKKRLILRSAQSQNDTLALRHRTPENPETEKVQSITHLSQLTGVRPLLRRCYCTMNIQVAGQKRKLLDYECEPGICIPGECDPYECQKLIMKRLMKNVSRMSGTESRSRSSSCETSSTRSCTRKLQSGFGEPRHRTRGHDPRSRPTYPQGLKYQTLPRPAQALASAPAPAQRQAVRVGSTFSFDIEFSKGSSKSAPTTDFVKVPKRQTSSRSSTAYHRHGVDRGTRYGGRRHHRETQSMMRQMRHRASSVTPMLKRCFCTLKLQKKGRQQKERELRGTDHGTSTPPKFSVENPILRTTERGQNTKRKHRFPELLPYECEPGICVPGECDPYECLELIKRRNKHSKDFGTDSMASTTSSSSMTSSQKRKRKRIQSRNIRAKQVRSRDTSIRSKPSVMSTDRQGQHRQVQDRPSKPSRQAVKISSNFSFNIEFYKDKTGPYNESDRRPSKVYVQKTPKEVRKVPKNVYAHKGMRESSSQYGKRSRDDDSQIGIYHRGRSTMTSGFLKRCFCTAKLQGINVDASTGARQDRSLAKLKRCFCTLKLMSATKRRRRGSNVGHERGTPVLDKRVGMTQTRGRTPPIECDSECEAAVKTQTRERFPALLPYECEPGVCEPGYCDPHECIKLIKKRLLKEKMTGTTGPRTTSTSSYFSSSHPSRARMTQSRSAWPKAKMTQSRTARRRERGRRRDYAPRKKILQEIVASPVSPQRQAVRIGSNFSFNIEFYKDKGSNNLVVQEAAPLVKKFRPIRMTDRSHGANRRTRDRGFRGRRFPTQSRDSQIDPTISRDIGLGPILKRCFCTLTLQKQSKTKGKTKGVTKASSKAASKAVTKAASKAMTKDASKAEAKVETKAETNAETSAETKTIQKETVDQKKKKSKQKNKCLCTPPIKEVATLHTKSVMTAKKPKETIVTVKIPKRRKEFPYKLEPYECEPGICVPGECDPYECLKLINKRLMYSSGTSTDRRGTRSTSNMTNYDRRYRHSETQSFMQRKKPMRTRETRIRDRERRAHRERRPESRSIEYRSTVVEKPTKQAVKLGSNFNFDIEFFKDKSLGSPVVTSRSIKRDATYDKPRRTSSRSTEGRSTYSRNKKAQLLRANRDMDSQALGPSMHSTMTGTVAPFLKRCFCTLQLHCKMENQGNPFDCLSVVSKREKVKSQAKRAEKNAYTRKQAQFHDRKLELCECEPGESDPYEYIKMLKRSKQAGTEPYRYRSISSSTDGEKKNIPRRIQTRSYGSRRNIKTFRCDDQCQDVTGSQSISSSSDERRKHRPRIKARSYSPSWRYVDTNPHRHALRIGSNVSINIEFFKDKSPQVPSVREVNKIIKKDEKNKVNGTSANRGTVAKSNITKKGKVARSKTTKKKSQSEFLNTDTKGIGTTPLLKRCFCTLKLEKKGKQRYITPTNVPSFKSVSTHTKSHTKAEIEPVAREIGTKTKNKNCKCNTQKPGQCKCDDSPKAKKCKCNTMKSCECKIEQKAEPDEFPCKEGKECICCKCNTYALKSIGYRCKKGKKCTCFQCNTPAFEPNEKSNEYRCKKGKECICCKCNAMDTSLKQDQNIIPVKKDKKPNNCKCNTQKCACDNSPKAKKCKCNIKKACKCDKITKKKNCKCNESCACETVQTSEKKTSTKGKYDPLQKFEPGECEKGVCEPGECSPYECLKNPFLRHSYGEQSHGIPIRRMSGTPDTRTKRASRVSNMAAQFIPGYTHKRTKYEGEPYSPENIESIVEEPRYPFLHGKDARQGVKITSNFSFNIEFFKEMLPPVVDNVKNDDKKKDSPRLKKENGRDTKNAHHDDKKHLYSIEPQARAYRTERTETASSPVAKLRKCFCMSKLQKSIHPQPLAVCRVEEIRPMTFFQPREYWVQYQTQQTKNYFKTKPQELETTMSYAPSRYEKNNNNIECRCCRKTNFGHVDPTNKGAHLKGLQSETKQSTLKKMFYYCKNLLSKRYNKQNIKNTEVCMEKKAPNKQPLIDILKHSKSERHPNKAAMAYIKKSKSLKVARVSGKDDYKKKYSRFQSGDYRGTKPQNTGIKLKKKCQNCQIKFKHAIPIHDKVRFTTVRTNKALKLKSNDTILIEQKKDTKPVSFLFQSLKFKTSEDIKYLKLCSCCGGIKRIRNLPSASNFLDIKNKLLEYSKDAITTVISKDLITIPTKIDVTEEETTLPQENKKKNKQACPCCVCKPKTEQGKKGGTSVVRKKEAEKRAEKTHQAECIKCKSIRGASICPAEFEKEALATESGDYRAPNKKKRMKKLEQEAKTCANFHKTEVKEIIEKENQEKYKSKKLTKYKSTPGSLLVAESVLDISKLELTSTGDILNNLHRAVSDSKGIYRKCQSYLCEYLRACNKFQKPANNGPGVDTLPFLKLRCQARKCVKEGEEILEDYPVANFAKHSNKADRKKGFHPKKPSWRRHPGCGFGWSPFMLSLRKRPCLSAYYKYAGSHPHCLSILQVWRQFMDIILFLSAVAVWSPCLLGIKLCRALKCCFLCMS